MTLPSTTAHESRLLALSPDLMGAAGFDGRLTLVNPAWGRLLGRGDDELLGTPLADLVHGEDRATASAAIARLAGGEAAQEFTCRMEAADGGERSILFSAQASADEGCFYVAGKDVTRLERINTELQEFAYIASHDLAEPLRMITSYLELLERRYGDQLDETAHEFMSFAVGGAVRMRQLIDDLLAYSRVGSHDMERRSIDLAGLLAAVLQGLERALEEAGATVETPGVLAPVSGDPSQIGQLLQNLVQNAVKFRRPDVAPVVTVTATAEDDGVRIAVADNGIGIAPAQQERIFKMFTRLHGRDEYEGTGIGLALCRRIADRHGGRIWVESELGRGSTFHVWLPGAP